MNRSILYILLVTTALIAHGKECPTDGSPGAWGSLEELGPVVSEVQSGKFIEHELEQDTAGPGPDWFLSNLTIKENFDEGKTKGFERDVVGGICTKFCAPSGFIIKTDADGNFLEVKHNDFGGLLKVGHKKLDDKEIKVLNEFVKNKLDESRKKGDLEIRSIISEVGLNNLSDKHKLDAVTGATKVENGLGEKKKSLILPKELKGAFNTVTTVLLYAYDTEKSVKEILAKKAR